MCYSSREDFGWGTKKDATRKPEERRDTAPAETPEPRAQADEAKLWAFLARRREHMAPKPMTDRVHEKV
ncbi:hypothetical protein [Arthrobacter sp. ZGTC131]|uniref:hypothetical protein n=1 Tax=Arthrobacter sp. ZGTC131 TaxID=2058898 RepID=UPI000CE3D99A|nr:hypothetical protein [Arthrobacter sp. ZGTC131]